MRRAAFKCTLRFQVDNGEDDHECRAVLYNEEWDRDVCKAFGRAVEESVRWASAEQVHNSTANSQVVSMPKKR